MLLEISQEVLRSLQRMSDYSTPSYGWVQIAVALGTLAYNAYKANQAKQKLNQLEHNKPEMQPATPEETAMLGRAKKGAEYGFSPEQKAAYFQDLARENNKSYSKAIQYGGNTMAGAIQGGINFSNLGATTKFASADASLKKGNERYADSLGQWVEGRRAGRWGQDMNQWSAAQAAWGKAQQDATMNAVSSAQTAAAMTDYEYGDQSKFGKTPEAASAKSSYF